MSPETDVPTRVVHCEDAIAWLTRAPVLDGCSVFTSLPDVSELAPMGLDAWRRWFVDAARLVVRFIRTQTRSHTVVDPFCGLGTALAAANEA